MERESSVGGIDESLAIKVSALSRGGQRWLKTAIQTIVTSDLLDDAAEEERGAPPALSGAEPAPLITEEPPKAQQAASLEDVITGKADLREHLEAYPELEDELEGLADVIDLLREAGESRRKRGEEILREEILGGEREDEAEPEDDDEVT